MIMSLKQKKIKFEPRIKLNHNIYNIAPHGSTAYRPPIDFFYIFVFICLAARTM